MFLVLYYSGLTYIDLFPEPLKLCTPGKQYKNAIVGLADGYGISNLKPMVCSIRKTIENTDIILLNNNNDKNFKKWANKNKVILLNYNQAPMKIIRNSPLLADFGVYRFRHYEEIVNTKCYHKYLLVDVRDIFFQNDIFKLTPVKWWNSVIVSLEGRNKYNFKGDVLSDNYNILNNPNHNLHMKMLNCMFKKKELEHLNKNGTMICSGVIGGGGDSLRNFLHMYNSYADIVFSNKEDKTIVNGIVTKKKRIPKCQRWIPDQMLLNFIVYHENINLKHIIMNTNENGFIYHQRSQLVTKHNDVPPFVMNENRTRVASVVHHFDRSRTLVEHSKKYEC